MGPINHLFSILCLFESYKQSIRIFTSKKSADNHFLVFLYGLGPEVIKLFKTNVYTHQNSLIDICGVDLSKLKNYNLFFNTSDLFLSSIFFDRCIIYNTIDYASNSRYIYVNFSQARENKISMAQTFSNANWLERELVEFFNIYITNRSDTRNLLLDYNFTANPLLKNYPTEGHQEIFFNHLTYNLEYVNAEFIEL